jgi:hypothetical protein
MSKKEIKIFEYEGKRITFDFENGQKMVNATEMVKAFPPKKIADFLRQKQTKEFVKKLESRYGNSHIGSKYKALRVVKGGNEKSMQGTWVSERLALKLASWLSADFEIWVYDRILELVTTGQTHLSKEHKRELEEMRKREKTAMFFLNKIFDNTLEANQLSKFLLDGQKLIDEEE